MPVAESFAVSEPAGWGLLRQARPVLWRNPAWQAQVPAAQLAGQAQGLDAMEAAQRQLQRFAPLLAALFPELQASEGRIRSPLLAVPRMQQALGLAPAPGADLGTLLLKADHRLPVAGSVKARGAVLEVLSIVQAVAERHGLWTPGQDPQVLLLPAARAVLARYTVAVGSTGNLGLAIGTLAAALGFQACVHMSAEAREWKKQYLRARGVTVIEHATDYPQALAHGRAKAAVQPHTHFVDNERSLALFLGYSTAAFELQAQLQALGRSVDAQHPLMVYLPCGVGGVPAGIAFGLRQLLGPHVHCWVGEPVQSPCVAQALLAPPLPGQAPPSVYALGLNNTTEADGLCVPQASDLAVETMRPVLAGGFTVADERLFMDLCRLDASEGLQIEPSAAAGFSGPQWLTSPAGVDWRLAHGLEDLSGALHVVWTTGGALVPPALYGQWRARGEALLAQDTAAP